MTTAPYPQITDELLSAYLDDEVNAAERRLVETAAADDPEVAWRLESLQATIQLLHELPALALPKSFVLTPEQVGQRVGEPAVASPGSVPLPAPAPVQPRRKGEPGLWARWRSAWQEFWRAGNPALRNAMAASFAVFLVLLVGPALLVPRQAAPQPELTIQQAPDAGESMTYSAESDALTGANLAAETTTLAAQTTAVKEAYPAPVNARAELAKAASAVAAADAELPVEATPVIVAAAVPERGSGDNARQAATSSGAPVAPPGDMQNESAQSAASSPPPPAARLNAPPDALGAAALTAPSAEGAPASSGIASPLADAATVTSGASGGPAAIALAAPSGESESTPAAALSESAPMAAKEGGEPVSAAPPAATVGATAAALAPPPATVLAQAPDRGATTRRIAEPNVAGSQQATDQFASPGSAPQPMPVPEQTPWLLFAQAAAAAGALVFGLLWWRTRQV